MKCTRTAERDQSDVGIRARPVNPDDWPAIERLFGPNGACGGCWCMWWRVPRGGKLWEESKGDKNKRAFRRLMKAGRVFGCLAFVGDEPVGWCCVGPREDFPRLERTRALASEWNSRTWGVTCFFIKPGWRKRGVAGALLAESIKVARSNGAVEIEAYPVRPKAETDIPAAFAWTGIPALFETHGFTCKAPRGQTRDVYVLSLRRRTGHRSPKR